MLLFTQFYFTVRTCLVPMLLFMHMCELGLRQRLDQTFAKSNAAKFCQLCDAWHQAEH